jgi:hypothetical protein
MQDSDTTYTIGAQICRHARRYLELPYLVCPLVGAHDSAEVFTIRRDGFDCVTLVETVLAECLSEAHQSTFEDELRALRYRSAKVEWIARLHYFSDWLATNEARGVLSCVFPEFPAQSRTLSFLAHYPERRAQLKFLPLAELASHRSRIVSGDILAFGTTRQDLDLAHTGFFERQSDGSETLIHATKTAGKVVAEPLEAFVARFGATPGILAYRLRV